MTKPTEEFADETIQSSGISNEVVCHSARYTGILPTDFLNSENTWWTDFLKNIETMYNPKYLNIFGFFFFFLNIENIWTIFI